MMIKMMLIMNMLIRNTNRLVTKGSSMASLDSPQISTYRYISTCKRVLNGGWSNVKAHEHGATEVLRSAQITSSEAIHVCMCVCIYVFITIHYRSEPS